MFMGFPGGSDSKESACNAGDLGSIPGSEKEMATHSSVLTWRIHGQRSLVVCSPWDLKESEATELSLQFTYYTLGHLETASLLFLHGEGDGTPLQYSCLKNPMDREAW